ncbi:MAG: hypothetical protein U0T69_00120 [Chitinophagales bacterium]
MKIFYKLSFFLLLVSTEFCLAQKSIVFRVVNVKNTIASDCDGVANDSDPTWWFQNSPNGTKCYGVAGSNSIRNDNISLDLMNGGPYTNAECWPTGNITYNFRPEEDDNALLDNEACNDISNSCSVAQSYAYPSASTSAGTTALSEVTLACQSGCDPAVPASQAQNYKYTANWIITGSWTAGNVNTTTGVLNNKTCATAIALTSGVARNNEARGCADTWYSYVSSNNSLLSFTSSGGGTITSYTGTCAGLVNTGQGSSISCPSNTTYYFQVQQGGSTNITLTATAITGNNLTGSVANNSSCVTAYDFGSTPATVTNQFKACNDIWYKYTPSVNMATITFTSSAGGTVNAYNVCGGSSIASGTGSLTLNCPSTQAYWFKVNAGGSNTDITIAASAVAGNNVTSGVVNNQTCATATTLTTDATGNIATNQEGRCTSYTWYKYTLTSAKATLTFDPSSSTDVQIYYTTDGVCTGCNVASGTGSAVVNDAAAGVYFVRVTNNANNMSLNVTYSGTPSNDNISNARNLGTLTAAGSTLSASDNNNSATQESGESLHPDNESSEETDWLYFTTSNTPPVSVDINLSGSGLDADYRLYYLNDNSYTFPRCNVNWSKLTYVGDGDGDNNVNCTVCGTFLSSNGTFTCLLPNTKYYIVVNGFQNSEIPIVCNSCSEDNGNYSITVDPVDPVAAPNNLCDVGTDLGTLAYNGTITKNNFSNYCASRETNEPNSTSGDETVWYKFTTNSTVPNRIDVDVDAIGGSGDGGACVLGEIVAGWVRIYEQTGTPCPTNFSNISQVGSNSDITTVTQDHWYFECVKPNTTYWIQVETGGLATCDKAHFNVTISGNGVLPPGNDKVCGVASVTTYDIGTAATVSAAIGTVYNISKSGTNINGTNCYDPNPTWGGVCVAAFNNDNDYGVWYKLPAAANRKDILIKESDKRRSNRFAICAL